jgi:hypothetical protein
MVPSGMFLCSAINGHHHRSRSNWGHSNWQLHLPENIASLLLEYFGELSLFSIEEIDSRDDERQEDVATGALNSRIVINDICIVKELAENTNTQQFIFMAGAPKPRLCSSETTSVSI